MTNLLVFRSQALAQKLSNISSYIIINLFELDEGWRRNMHNLATIFGFNLMILSCHKEETEFLIRFFLITPHFLFQYWSIWLKYSRDHHHSCFSFNGFGDSNWSSSSAKLYTHDNYLGSLFVVIRWVIVDDIDDISHTPMADHTWHFIRNYEFFNMRETLLRAKERGNYKNAEIFLLKR